jgi:hypothetical protein
VPCARRRCPRRCCQHVGRRSCTGWHDREQLRITDRGRWNTRGYDPAFWRRDEWWDIWHLGVLGRRVHISINPYITNCLGVNAFAVAMIDLDSDLYRLTPTATRRGAYSSTGVAAANLNSWIFGRRDIQWPSKRFCMPLWGTEATSALSSAVIDHFGLGNSTARARVHAAHS